MIQAKEKKARTRKRGWFGILGLGALLLLGAAIGGEETRVWSVSDGNRVIIHTSQKEDPEEILEQLGVSLGADDSYCVTREGDRNQIQILRGKKRNHIREKTEQYTAVLEPGEIRCLDPALPAGLEILIREGSWGESRCIALVTYTNGVETGRKLLDQKVTTAPVDRIIALGIDMPGEGEDGEPVIRDGLIYLPSGEVLSYDRVMTSLATAYCDKGLTATGTQARVGAIAVDPKVIPYGTRVFIVSKDGEYVYGPATAEDCGSKEHIYDTRIDLHFDTYEECRQFGARYCRVYFLS